MALRKASDTQTPAFEDDNDVALADRPEASAADLADENGELKGTGEPAPSNEVAAPGPTKEQALALRRVLDPNTMLRGLKDAIPTSELQKMNVGVFPRITATQGGLVVDKDKKKLGQRIRFSVISWSDVMLITAGEQNDPEANKLIRTTYTGVLDDGMTAAAYCDLLKSDGYKNAQVKEYVELYGTLLGYEELKDRAIVPIDIPEDEQELYQVSLSPQSNGKWRKYLLEGALRKAKGVADDSVLTITQDTKTLGANTFGFMTFSSKW